jgi:hypothetical protein
VFKVISTAGDTFLGGEDFDAAHHRLARGGLPRAEHGIDLRTRSHGPAAAQGRRREGQDASCRWCARPRSTSRSSSRAGATRPCTCSDAHPRRSSKSSRATSSERTLRDLPADPRRRGPRARRDRRRHPRGRHDAHAARAGERSTEFFGASPARAFTRTRSWASARPSRARRSWPESLPGMRMVLLDVTPHTLGIMVSGGTSRSSSPRTPRSPRRARSLHHRARQPDRREDPGDAGRVASRPKRTSCWASSSSPGCGVRPRARWRSRSPSRSTPTAS